MAEIFNLRPSEHDQVQELLPWLVNRTLSHLEASRVETHLAECDECREELAFDQKLARGIAMLPLNTDDGWTSMQVRMTETSAPKSLGKRQVLSRRSVPLGWVAGGALAASIAAAVFVVGIRPVVSPEQTYRTLGSAPAAKDGQIVVLFKPNTTEQQMTALLSSVNARVVDGPTASGAYVLRVQNGDAGAAVAHLDRSANVILAEPLVSDGRP